MIAFKKSASTQGIEKCHPAELPPEFYALTNRWTGIVNGKHTTIFAGALRHNQTKGVLVLRSLPADSKRVGGRHCTVPANSGALRIVERQGNRLLISMQRGGYFWYDLPIALRQAA